MYQDQFLGELIDQVRSAAEWRKEKYSEYPEDKRNKISAEALTDLANNLEKVASDHSLLTNLEARLNIDEMDVDDVFRYYEAANRFISRYGGFEGGSGDAEEFLRDLIEIAKEEIEGADKPPIKAV